MSACMLSACGSSDSKADTPEVKTDLARSGEIRGLTPTELVAEMKTGSAKLPVIFLLC